ncbi:bacillithiol biosynthesis deacetylase BshB1 [Moheibacter lacus]|uniref:Bacillithiol biosynthesis deacetylase BshB1 n=1 Tax=Moheibacter lacus TaxID=2745851 RepID=A0A838ZRV0_9FLAO|nr:bacillithiol biosynthesis deacetylase BshB1 [Moheibacter lacus]MBA5629592.1 bacillithiol biosynthesis deacetylase BshB1 [Moheibacter lacus]
MKLDILAFGAHPDDVELGAGATVAKMVAAGKTVGIIDLTQGELGTRGTAETRKKEAADAAQILGVAVRENLGFRDGFFKNDEAHQMKIIEIIRKYQPEIVLCNAVEDRHIDHGKGAELVEESCFLSGLKKIETGQEAWRPKNIFHYIQWFPLKPDFVLDVSGYVEKKKAACFAYTTQFHDPNNQEPDTPISSKLFQDSIENRAKDLGMLIGTQAGEGFMLKGYLGLKDFEGIL